MALKFIIRNIFTLPGDLTVLACEGSGSGLPTLSGRVGRIENDGKLRQSIIFSGERKMLNQTRHQSIRAFETLERVQLTVEEAQTGTWVVIID